MACKSLLYIFIGAIAVLIGCSAEKQWALEADTDPLTDSLVAILGELRLAANSASSEDFTAYLDPIEKERLGKASVGFGFNSFGSFLERHMAGWPDPDTLVVEDVAYYPPFARLALIGAAGPQYNRPERVRYTFLLFRMGQERWRLAGVSSLEKRLTDPYGNRLGYFETELPPRLRFPRLP